ncbi:FUSC family protein [Frateuria aurantia]
MPLFSSMADSLRTVTQLHREVIEHYKQQPISQRIVRGLIQASLAVTASSAAYGLGLLLHTQNAFWAALTAISVTQQSYADTRSSSHDQWVGALLGGAAALLGSYIGGEHYYVYAITLVVGIVASWAMNIGSAGKITGTTVATVLLVPHSGSFWSVALIRLLEVAIGVVCALLATRALNLIQDRMLGRPE